MQELLAELDRRDPAGIVAVDAYGAHPLGAVLAAGDGLAAAVAGTCGPGATLLVQADNTWRTVAAAAAAGRLGGMLALISRHATPAEFAAAVEDIDPDAVVAAPEHLGDWGAPLGHHEIGGSVLDGWRAVARPARPAQRWAGGAVIGLTSGSTGRAKGVVQAEAALRYASAATIESVGLRAGEPVAAMVPLSSTAAVCFGMYLPLLLGSPIVLSDRWDPAAAVALLAEQGVRWTMCVPTMALQLAAAAPADGMLHRVRAMTVGGGPMDAGALGRAERRLGTRILRVFGMSECLGHTTPRPDDPEDIRLGRDGRPFPGTVLRAVDTDGAPVAAGEVGRAQVRGPSLFLGYAREGATAAPELTPDGFFPTGDLVAVNGDGTVSIRGREKDIIIRGGRNIDITEVEAAVARHPAVEQVCVVPVPDELLGERVAVLVVTGDEALDLAAVTRHLAECGLTKGKWPEFVFRVPQLPLNRVGKLSRPDATRIARDLHAGVPAG